MRFQVQPCSSVSASLQLYSQLSFAIASRFYLPGHRLPSTRQLAMQTNLHRNTVSKVYRQLEAHGIVEAVAGSGVYVRGQAPANPNRASDLHSVTDPGSGQGHGQQDVGRCIDTLLCGGLTLQETLRQLTTEINWRISCGAQVLVSTPQDDLGAAHLMARELTTLPIPVTAVSLESLDHRLAALAQDGKKATVVTSRYFLKPVEEVTRAHNMRCLVLDLSSFDHELNVIAQLRTDTCVGLVSISSGILRAAELILQAQRGQELLVMTALVDMDNPQVGRNLLLSVCRASGTILCDQPSHPVVEATIRQHRSQMLRVPNLHCIDHYLRPETVDVLSKEMGLRCPVA
ncbi:MAG: GntR family transcriptional regulator [Synechococcus sp. SB0662_bin_45]|nr:GntR family transcriptional regulator [Cyanobacteria bacterium MAG IRC3_bin_20]MDE0648583.1 GntR family transcriptional regulator [Cyanobacteria bacterium MAG IRC4_bin_6]MXW13214.1 GntR family transcriptional regulator [Synechococcus sp. SB0668_bin_13]MXY19559.1 GntR family transcriptional regulator [Synechococcus sp. SB0664_bin_36]MYE20799.1 GntR family transcriptional regulator [Synechococcus sp. SB0662_bin_45]MYF20881.1 GntR family transcriptional regulator [Synechococcus sp. SB0677_bin_